MRIIASGDHHWDRSSRWEECQQVHGWIAEYVAAEQPDLFLSAGDIYERASTPEERDAVATWLTRIAEVCPVVVVKGNHDRRLDCHLLARLRTRHPVIVEEGAGVHVVAGVAVAALAWPERQWLRASLPADASAENVDDVAREALRSILLGLRQELEQHDGPRVLLTHAMIDGAVVSTGQPLIGQPMNVGLDDLALAAADVVIAGHIHKPQAFESRGSPVLYTGSPYRTAYGEMEEKSVLRLEFDGRPPRRTDQFGRPVGERLVSWGRVATPAAGMVLMEGSFSGEAGEIWWDDWPDCDAQVQAGVGAEVRLRYSVAADHREAAKSVAKRLESDLRDAGARDVKVEEVVEASTRARVPEMASAVSVEDMLRALWRARSDEPDEERADRLLGKAHELEAEVSGG